MLVYGCLLPVSLRQNVLLSNVCCWVMSAVTNYISSHRGIS
ncbi:unnamed protein product [Onchocerca flexuosa]|uniref:Uncharacterized protein n=1 Tax=Onchocerca flexuosa TaxID=387005 RepID=A0A183HLI3_9BILA|nr:unnamed protein product [Onchocerca flexuosa]